MRSSVATLAIVSVMLAAPARGEVVETSADGFSVRNAATINAPPATVYATLTDKVGGWWDPAHTFSHDARNLSVDAKPGGCFCERIPETGGGVEHMHVAFVEPGKRMVMTGSLGPLLYEATNGVMDVQVKTRAGGSILTIDYKVAGFANGGAEKMAPQVDEVLEAQLKRFRDYVTRLPRN